MVQIVLMLALVAGAMLWLAGVRTARALFATVLAGGGALAGWAIAVSLSADPPAAGALIGGSLGFLAGYLLFPFAQATVLALTVGIVATGGYYAVEILPTRDGSAGAAIAQLARTPSRPASAVAQCAWAIAEKEFSSLPSDSQHKLLVLAAGSTLIAFVVALGFRKQATILMTATAGSAILLASAGLLWRLYGTTPVWPQKPSSIAILWALLTLVGIAVQCRIGATQADKSSKTTRSATSDAALSPA